MASNRAGTLLGSMGAWRDRHLRVHACLLPVGGPHLQQVFVWGVSTIALNVSITGQTFR
jgi:hypothetical protein